MMLETPSPSPSPFSVSIPPVTVAPLLTSTIILLVLLTATLAVLKFVMQRRVRYERELSTRTAEAVGQQIGVQSELVLTTTSAPAETIRRPISPSGEARIDRRWHCGLRQQWLNCGRFSNPGPRLWRNGFRAIEEKFPDAAEFQKYADANGLFLAYQIGELGKRMDRIEDMQLSRTQVAGIVTGTLLAASL